MRPLKDNKLERALRVVSDAKCSIAAKLVYLDRTRDAKVYATLFHSYLDRLYLEKNNIELIKALKSIYAFCHDKDKKRSEQYIKQVKRTSDTIWSVYNLNSKQRETRKQVKQSRITAEYAISPNLTWRQQLDVADDRPHVFEKPGITHTIAPYLEPVDHLNFSLARQRIRQQSLNHHVLNLNRLPDETEEEFMSYNWRSGSPNYCRKGFLSEGDILALINMCGDDVTHVNLSAAAGVTDTVVEHLLKKLPNVKSLNLSSCSCISLRALQAIAMYGQKLESLNLSACSNVKDALYQDEDIFSKIAKNCKSLKCLKLEYSPLENDSLIKTLAEHCPNLELLNLCGNRWSELVDLTALLYNCKKLRGLGMHAYGGVFGGGVNRADVPDVNTMKISKGLKYLRIEGCDSQLLQQLIIQNDQLTTLDVGNITIVDNFFTPFISRLSELKIDQCQNFTPQQLIDILPQCKNLKRLGLAKYLSTKEVLDAVAKHCPNLSHLELHELNYRPAALCCVLEQCKELRSLCLMTKGDASWQRYDYIQVLQHGAKLSSLALVDCVIDRYILQAIEVSCPNLINLDFAPMLRNKRAQYFDDNLLKCVKNLEKLQTLTTNSDRLHNSYLLSGRDLFIDVPMQVKESNLTQPAKTLENKFSKDNPEYNNIKTSLDAVAKLLKSGDLAIDERNKIIEHQTCLLAMFAAGISWMRLSKMDSDTRYYVVEVASDVTGDLQQIKSQRLKEVCSLFETHLSFEDVKSLPAQLQIFTNDNAAVLDKILHMYEDGLKQLKSAGITWEKIIGLQSLALIGAVIQNALGVIQLINMRVEWENIAGIEPNMLLYEVIKNSSNIAIYMSKGLSFNQIKNLGHQLLSRINKKGDLKEIFDHLLATVDISILGQLIVYPAEIRDGIINEGVLFGECLQNGITLQQLVSLQELKRNAIIAHPTAVKRLKAAGVTFYMLKVLQQELLNLVLEQYSNVIILLQAKVTWEQIINLKLETLLALIFNQLLFVVPQIESGISWDEIITLNPESEVFNESETMTFDFLNQFDQMQTKGQFTANRFLTCEQNQRNNDTSLFAHSEEVGTIVARLHRLFEHLSATIDCNHNSLPSPFEIFSKKKSGRSTWKNVCALLGVEETKIKQALARGKTNFNKFVTFHYIRSQESEQAKNTKNP